MRNIEQELVWRVINMNMYGDWRAMIMNMYGEQ